MANFARFWKSFNSGEARKGAELPYAALVKIDGTNYRVGNYDSVHDEYSLVTRQDGKTVIKKFPAAQVEGVSKDIEDKEFIGQNLGEDDNEENIENLDNAKKSNPDPKDDPENRYPEDVTTEKSVYRATVIYQTDGGGKKRTTLTFDALSENEARDKVREVFYEQYPRQGGYFFDAVENNHYELIKKSDTPEYDDDVIAEQLKRWGASPEQAKRIIANAKKSSPGYDGDVGLDETVKSSRVYGASRFTEDEAFGDLKTLVNNNEGHVLQAYVDYDDDKGQYYACVTLGDKAIIKSYQVGDKIMRKGRKYVITEIRSDGKYVLKPASDSRGRDGSWVEEKEIHGHAKKSVVEKDQKENLKENIKALKFELEHADDQELTFADIHALQRELKDAKEKLSKLDNKTNKDISPYGQAFNSGTILGAHKGDDTSEYEVKPTHATNINNMDPEVLENEDDYVVEPTYAMINDEATKKSLEEQIAEVEKAIYSLKTYEKAEKHELYAKHSELTAQLNICVKNMNIAKSTATKTAIEFSESKVPTLKEVLKNGGLAKAGDWQLDDAASEVCNRFDVGGYGWEQRATLWLTGKGLNSGDVKKVLVKALELEDSYQ